MSDSEQQPNRVYAAFRSVPDYSAPPPASEALRELREQRRLTAFVLGENRALHHRDGNPYNNDPANLEIVETGDHINA